MSPFRLTPETIVDMLMLCRDGSVEPTSADIETAVDDVLSTDLQGAHGAQQVRYWIVEELGRRLAAGARASRPGS